jgi:hypothetical protein
MHLPTILCLATILLVPACSGGDAVPAGEEGADVPHAESVAPSSAQQQPSQDELRDLAIAFGLPRILAVNAYLSRYMVVEAVYQATALSGAGMYGQVTNTGTLTNEYGVLQYSPQPADRLVVRLGQETDEFVLLGVQGNVQAPTAASWLASPHMIRYRHVLPGQAQMEMAVQFDGINFQSEVTGWYQQSGQRYSVSLRAAGRSMSQRDMTGQESRTEYDLTGTLSREGFTLEVAEHHLSTLAAASHPSRLLPSQRGSASRFNGSINSVLRSGGAELRFVDVTVQTDMMQRGGTSGAGLTHLGGSVTRDGALLGQCVLRNGGAFLETGSGLLPLDLQPPD